MKRRGMDVAFSLLAAVVLAVGASGMTLVREGKPVSIIVTGNNPVPSQKVAAQELQYHLKKMTGAVVPIQTEQELGATDATLILVGQSDLLKARGIDTTKLPRETIIVKTIDGALVLAGEDGGDRNPYKEPYDSSRVRSGTLYAVYDLLEDQLGVRWLWPGEIGEVVPPRSTVEIDDLDIQETPKMFQRHFRQGMKEGTRTLCAEYFPRYMASREKTFTQMEEDESRWLKRMRMGYSQKISYGHAFTRWLDQYGDTDPEIFALQKDGHRGLAGTSQPKAFVKMCVSEPKLVDMLIEQFKKQRAENPDFHYLNAVENDGSAGFCLCDRCRAWDHEFTEADRDRLADMGWDGSDIDRALTPGKDGLPQSLTDRYFHFYNILARRVREVDPEGHVVTYAYSRYRYAPIDVKLEPNILVGLIGFNGYPMSESQHRFEVDNFMAWKQAGATEMFFRPNSFCFSPAHGIPWGSVEQMGGDFKMLVDNGMVATDWDTLNGFWATAAPTYYVLARLHWDADMDERKLLDEWCQGYGPAADAVKAYFLHWEKVFYDAYTRPDIGTIGRLAEPYGGRISDRKAVAVLITPYDFDKGRELLAAARAAAEAIGDPYLLERIHVLELGQRHGELTVDAAKFSFGTKFYDDDVFFDKEWPKLKELLQVREDLLDLQSNNSFWLLYWEMRTHDYYGTRAMYDFFKTGWRPVMTPADKQWRFVPDPDDQGEAESWPANGLAVPKLFNRDDPESRFQHLFFQTWDNLKDIVTWKRANGDKLVVNGWFQASFSVPEKVVKPETVLYIPEIVGQSAKIWVNDRLVREVDQAAIGAGTPITIPLQEVGIKPKEVFRLTIKVHSPKKPGGILGPAYIAEPDA